MGVRDFFRLKKDHSEYVIMRFVLLRFLGFVFLFAFISLTNQVLPLIGSEGLLPAESFMSRVASTPAEGFMKIPSLFWVHLSDSWLLGFAWVGIILSILLLVGFANAPLILLLWALYMSFYHIGQTWYSFGWETQLLETSFLAAFLVPLWDPRPFSKMKVPMPIVYLFRWLAFRIYIGAGFIKLRGDECWRDLTCLVYHYETQPIPGPLSRLFHFVPVWVHKVGVLWNHFVEVIVPAFIFGGRWFRNWAGVLLVSFQFILILSGNLSFLNWLTIIPCIACFDDQFLSRFMPKWVTSRAETSKKKQYTSRANTFLSWCVVVVVVVLSIPVVNNLFFSDRQLMNASFNNLHLVNTYGAFGSVGSDRWELVVEGSMDGATWVEYDFIGKPTALDETLPLIAPYQPRVDWQIWFAAMTTPDRAPWMLHFAWKLLHNDEGTLSLLESNPFPNDPPTYVRVQRYKYTFAPLGSGAVWERELVGDWLPPLTKEDEQLKLIVERYF